MPSTLVLLLAAGALAAAPPPDPVVATAGWAEVRASDVRRELPTTAATREDLARALRATVATKVLAAEARARGGDEVRALPDRDAAARHLAALFDPAERCASLPEAQLRRRYVETRYRFQAPPAWTVDDLQLLCCTSARACADPEVAPCRHETRPLAEALWDALPDLLDAATFGDAFLAAASDDPRLALTRYTFFFDPAHPDARIDPRLQRVDAPVADAAARLRPGELAPVVTTRFGHHVVRLVATRPAVDQPFEDPRTQATLRAELCAERLDAERERYISDLLAPVGLVVHREALSTAFPELAPR